MDFICIFNLADCETDSKKIISPKCSKTTRNVIEKQKIKRLTFYKIEVCAKNVCLTHKAE